MKIVHIHEIDGQANGAGAHIVMNQLHHGLKRAGVDSKIICARKSDGFDDAYPIRRPVLIKIIERVLGWVTVNLGLNNLNFISCLNILKMQEFQDADIIHIHGLHSGFFSFPLLSFLAKRKPIVYTLHDMWPFTGHCITSLECERWTHGCGACPHPDAFPAINRDNTRLEWTLKNRSYKRSKPHFITVSTLQEKLVSRSMLSNYSLRKIPHGIDCRIYQPLSRNESRVKLGISPDRKVIMFGATDILRFEKGSDLLQKALEALPNHLKEHITLLSFGRNGDALSKRTGMESVSMGYVDGDDLKASLYSAADIFVMSSRQESFGMVTLESMACGTPVVSFDVGAASDLVHTNRTGYLAKAEDYKDLSKGICHLLEGAVDLQAMGETCRKVVTEDFGLEVWINRHVSLYDDVQKEK